LIYNVNGKHTLKVFENRMLRKRWGPTGEEVTGGWGNLHSERFII
jgi:hypothetical protein